MPRSSTTFSPRNEAHFVHGYARHNGRQHRLYNIWHGMKQRCHYKKHKSYPQYGGCGIVVCEEWHAFIPFQKWALEAGYEDGLTLDRIDPDKGYSPDNCRWIPGDMNFRNIRRNRHAR